LYVGISSDATWRQIAHQRTAGWWRQVRRIEISEPYATRADALAAEAQAIRTERPLWNQQHHPAPVADRPVAPSQSGKALFKRLAAAQRQAEAAGEDTGPRIEDTLAELERLRERSLGLEGSDGPRLEGK
jgi:hypothetical protein